MNKLISLLLCIGLCACKTPETPKPVLTSYSIETRANAISEVYFILHEVDLTRVTAYLNDEQPPPLKLAQWLSRQPSDKAITNGVISDALIIYKNRDGL